MTQPDATPVLIAALEEADREAFFARLMRGYDPALGLWGEPGPGRSPETSGCAVVHPGRVTAWKILALGHLGLLARVDVQTTLVSLRQMQDLTRGETHGCIRWYWEDARLEDSNAAFFTARALILLALCYEEQRRPERRALLRAMLADFSCWFAHALAERNVRYPNPYLGNLACQWLSAEILGRDQGRDEVLAYLLDAAAYWRDSRWGWGEHLSDIYASVCMDGLSFLLCLARTLPAEARRACTDLLNDLLRIEDAYGSGPRVPAIRSYALAESPQPMRYRASVRPWQAEDLQRPFLPPIFGAIFNAFGWHDRVAPPQPAAADIAVDCIGGAQATARVFPDIRLGSLSRYPIMEDIDHESWGLAWQSFPVAVWRPAGDWGFLQWVMEREDARCLHPAEERHKGHSLKTLGDPVSGPILGRTWSVQHGPRALVLRQMSAPARPCLRLCDRFRIVQSRATAVQAESAGAWSELTLAYPERNVAVSCLALSPCQAPARVENAHQGFDWGASAELSPGGESYLALWSISLAGACPQPPQVQTATPAQPPEAKRWRVHWCWPDQTWEVAVQPGSDSPLQVAARG